MVPISWLRGARTRAFCSSVSSPQPSLLSALQSADLNLHCCLSLQSTFEFHYGKHHQAYVTNLNNQIAGKDLESLSIEEVSRGATHLLAG
jgi:superoxide dismutase